MGDYLFIIQIEQIIQIIQNWQKGEMRMPKYFSGKRDVFLEIADRYANYIRLGVLKDGDRLPSVRVAAGQLNVNPNTVQKAYTYLEEQGLISTLPKKGVYVTYGANQSAVKQDSPVMQAIMKLKEAGVEQAEILSAVKEVYGND